MSLIYSSNSFSMVWMRIWCSLGGGSLVSPVAFLQGHLEFLEESAAGQAEEGIFQGHNTNSENLDVPLALSARPGQQLPPPAACFPFSLQCRVKRF
jgi:hypothetical protein